MKKISKSLSKKIALALVLSSMVGMHDALADAPDNQIKIAGDGTYLGAGIDPMSVTPGAGIGVVSGTMGDTVNRIYTDGALNMDVYGIRVDGSYSVTATSIVGGIEVVSATGTACGIQLGAADALATGTITISNLANIKAEAQGSTGHAYGIYTDGADGAVSITEFVDDRKIIVTSSNGDAYGIMVGTTRSGINSTTATTTVSNLGSIDVTAKRNAFGIEACKGTSNIAFSGAGSYISVKSNEASSHGINMFNLDAIRNYPTLAVTGIDSIKVEGNSNADGISVTGGYINGEIKFSGAGEISVNSTSGAAKGILIVGGQGVNVTIANLKKIEVSGNADSKAIDFASTGKLILQPERSETAYITVNAPIRVNYTSSQLQFDLPADCVAGDTIVSIKGAKKATEIKNGILHVNDGAATQLNMGDEICLISDDTYAITLGKNVKKIRSSDGVVTSEAEIYVNPSNDKQLMYKKTGSSVSKAPIEGMATANAIINNNTDLVVGAGMSNMITSANTSGGAEPFAAANFGSTRLETGSHVDTRGYGIVVGVGKKGYNKKGDKTTGGLFVEYGNSNFDTYNDNNINGDGKNIYKGGGFMIRYDSKKSGNYYEGMIHVGKTNTTWRNNTIGSYDVSPNYYGAAATYGHKFMFKDNNQVSVYGAYICNRTGSATANIGKYKYEFDTTNSRRTRLGVRYAKSDLMDTLKYRPYVGLAWEHEFSAETAANVLSGNAFVGNPASPSMKGNTGVLEFGCNMEAGKWTLGVGANLYTGKRRGWTGSLNAVLNF